MRCECDALRRDGEIYYCLRCGQPYTAQFADPNVKRLPFVLEGNAIGTEVIESWVR